MKMRRLGQGMPRGGRHTAPVRDGPGTGVEEDDRGERWRQGQIGGGSEGGMDRFGAAVEEEEGRRP